MNDKEIINTLAATVARMFYDYEIRGVRLGPEGSIVDVDDDGQVAINGAPVGERDDGMKSARCFQILD